MALDDRKKLILRAIVENYIKNAEPVGSRSIAKSTGLNLSAATIRNEMGDLEELGYLTQPHTSAGRVPSSLGFRFYVDSLMDKYLMTAAEIQQLKKAMLNKVHELDQIVKDVSVAFSNLTLLPTFGMLPTIETGIVKSIKLVGIDERTVMIIVADSSGVIKNKLLRLHENISPEILIKLNDVLNANLTCLTASEINLSHIIEIQNAVGVNTEILTSVLELVHEAISEIDKHEVYMEGSTNILRFPEYNNIEKIKEILGFFDNKKSIDEMITKLPDVKSDKVSVFIGDENPVAELKNNSVVISSYKIGDNMTGIVGVVGPMRMDYSKVVSGVGFFARQLEDMLGKHFSEPDKPNKPPALGDGSTGSDNNS